MRAVALALTLVLMLSFMTLPAGAASVIKVNDINVMVNNRIFQPTDTNGKPVRVFEYNGTTYAPLRALAEAYGLSVGYSPEARCAYVYEGTTPDLSGIKATDTNMVFPATNGKAQLIVQPINIVVKGKIFQPKDANGNPVPVFETGGTTYAPLRALAESYGLEVGYDSAKRLAYVTQPNSDSAFTQLPDGSTLVAAKLKQPQNDGTVVPSPITYFSRTTKPGTVRTDLQELEHVHSSAVPDYLNLLNEFGFELCATDLNETYNTWFFYEEGQQHRSG